MHYFTSYLKKVIWLRNLSYMQWVPHYTAHQYNKTGLMIFIPSWQGILLSYLSVRIISGPLVWNKWHYEAVHMSIWHQSLLFNSFTFTFHTVNVRMKTHPQC